MNKKTVRDALCTAMREEMRRDKNIVILGEEVAEYQGAYKVTQGLLQEFGPDRVIDTPITEHGFAGIGVGMALSGLVPIVEFMTFNFAMQAIDQIINSAAKTLYMSGGSINCPIVFRGPNGAASRVAAQHSQCFASWYAHIPGLKVIAPFYASDCEGLLKAAIRDPNPVVFLEHELVYGVEHEMRNKGENFEIGKARIAHEGSDLTIVTFSIGVGQAMEAANILEKEYGLSIEVLDLLTLRPLDTDAILKSVRKTNRLITLEEGWAYSGIGAEISSFVVENAFDDLDAPIIRISAKDVPLPYAKSLESMALPNIQDIVEATRKIGLISTIV